MKKSRLREIDGEKEGVGGEAGVRESEKRETAREKKYWGRPRIAGDARNVTNRARERAR